MFQARGVEIDGPFDFASWRAWQAGQGVYVGHELQDFGASAWTSPEESEENPQGSQASVLEFLDREYSFGGGPGEVHAYLEGSISLGIEEAVKFAAFLGCRIGDFSPYHQRQVDLMAELSTLASEADDLHGRVERQERHLAAVADALPELLNGRHAQLKAELVGRVRSSFVAADAPEDIEGIDNGLDYLGLLKGEGSHNGLDQIGMDGVDGAVRHAVCAMPPSDQVALLLPLCARRGSDVIREMVSDPDVRVANWPEILLRALRAEWTDQLRDEVMATVPERRRP